MKWRLLAVLLLLTLVPSMSLLAEGNQETEAAGNGTITIELWDEHNKEGAFDTNHPWSKFLKEQTGVALKGPYISWNGGEDYLQQLRLRIATNKLPDVFLPWDGIEYDLADQGALVELSELLPKYAPTIWNGVPSEIWDIVRANSPDGEGIYYIPSVWTVNYGSGFIRNDWLDKLGVGVPQTIDEFEAIMRRVKNEDVNGNGDPNDEIPAGGRQNARWMDHLFAPYGVAMYEGFPQFAIYDGEMTFSATTPNMRAALQWLSELYAEGLLDPETLLNSKAVWDGKVANDQALTWFHLPMFVWRMSRSISTVQPDVDIEYFPALEGSGFEPSYFTRTYRRPQWCFADNGDENKVIAALKLLDFIADPKNDSLMRHGAEGYSYKIENGKEVRLPVPTDRWVGIYNTYLWTDEFVKMQLTNEYIPQELRAFYENAYRVVQKTRAKPMEGQALPAVIYDGYPDIQSNKLYFECAAKIIIGEWPISKFDEFVEKWYATGGEEVTERARDFWSRMNK